MMLPKPFCRQLDQVTLFFIPIVSLENNAASCAKSRGMIVPLDKAEYKRRREASQKVALSEPLISLPLKKNVP